MHYYICRKNFLWHLRILHTVFTGKERVIMKSAVEVLSELKQEVIEKKEPSEFGYYEQGWNEASDSVVKLIDKKIEENQE